MLKKNFVKGKMNLDADERLLPSGEFREALNINVINSEGSDVGAIENSLSNKQLTNIDLGSNPKTISCLEDEAENKIYWHVKSDKGCYLIEWDDINKLATVVLKDTRPEGAGRVLELHEDHLITGITKVISEDTKEDLLLWTDDNMQPCCINIDRAKTWGENNFDLEDILLIKKPPRYAPKVTPTYTNDLSNNLEERFISVSYRYKYRDGEYSALSDYANYAFYPKPFDLDYYTLDNKGMINSFNAMLIEFNTGDKRVTDIQIVIKTSNSNSLYIVETFNKKNLSWEDNIPKQTIFSNDKVYMQLDSNELSRAFDNVPLKSKALALIGNIPVFGNYLEGRDIVDKEGKPITIDYTLANITKPLLVGNEFEKNISLNVLEITNPENISLNEGTRFLINFNIELDGYPTYENDFFFVLNQDYTTLEEMFGSDEFDSLLNVINNDFVNNYDNEGGGYEVPDGWVVSNPPSITYSIIEGVPSFTINPVTFQDTYNENEEHIVDFTFTESSYASLSSTLNSTSIKTNRNLSVGIVYQDRFNRRTTVLTSSFNSIFIPQKHSVFINTIQATINNPAPAWADRYKLVVKAQPLQYQTIYVNQYYNEDFFVWCKLEAENKDKVKIGETLILKRSGPIVVSDPIKVKVLDIQYKEKNFITDNSDSEGNEIKEPSGVYMKIRPDQFSMDFNDYEIHQREVPDIGSSNHPKLYLDLFSKTELGVVTEELSITAGSSIYLYLNSSRNLDSGWKNATYEKTHYAQRNYDTIEEWFQENIMNRYLKATVSEDETMNYQYNIKLVRGLWTNTFPSHFIETDEPTHKLHLKVEGLFSGGSNGRSGYVRARIVVRNSIGVYVFETEPKQADNDIYYETEQCFDIIDGNHTGNNQDQDLNTFTPAVVDLDFFNCYTQGNGVESFRVRDAFNTPYLNIDLRPSATSVEKYRAVRRFADLTYGGAFIESSNINKLNEFNLSLGNWKELDKQYGSVQKLESRDSDLIVIQENKASKVLFGKDLLNTAEGVPVLTGTPKILGQQIPIPGENGIGLNPESFAKDTYRLYWVNPRRGTPIRYSMDGITEINYGLVSFFRSLFIENPTSKKIGGYDPYHKQYFLSVEDEIPSNFVSQCGNSVFKILTEPFVYYLNLNSLSGTVTFNYNITSGTADIMLVFDGVSYIHEDLTGIGTISFERENLNENLVEISINPTVGPLSIEISSVCPIGVTTKVGSIVLCDDSDTGKSIKNKYRWGQNPFYQETHIFGEGPISKFLIEEGSEGLPKFPIDGETINIQSYKDGSSTGDFSKDKCNRIGYLISPNIYTEEDIETILNNATWLNLTETQISLGSFISQANFVLNKNLVTDVLYLIWDYIDRKPIANNDFVSMPSGSSSILDVLSNDVNLSGEDLIVEIVTPPINGVASVNLDKTITYTHNGSNTDSDSFTYRLIGDTCTSDPATVDVEIAVQCDASFSQNGGPGVFSFNINFGSDTGMCGIAYDAFTIPDKFEIEWDGQIVATTTNEVAGQGTLLFDKTSANPRIATIHVIAQTEGTAWNISGVCPNVSPFHKPSEIETTE